MLIGLSTKWILAIIGASITILLYLVCCICSIHKAIKDRKQIIERNCNRRNQKYLKEMGIITDKHLLQTNRTGFAISKNDYSIDQFEEHIPTCPTSHNTMDSSGLVTNAKKINLNNIDEILNESISINASTNSSFFGKSESENAQFGNRNTDIRSNQQSSIGLRNPLLMESTPKFYYLKAHNSQIRNKGPPSNWITERLNDASSFANAQRKLQYGLVRAPLAKQNSGFSSMDEDSSASQY